MHRFFSQEPLTSSFSVSGEIFHQISHVFRAKAGERFIFFEARGDDIVYEIQSINKKEILFVEKERNSPLFEQKCEKILFQSYPHKMQTIELIVQKIVELGFTRIFFFPSQHSQIVDISPQKKQRLNAIAREALEQSGRNIPIEINFFQEKTRNVFEQFHKNSSMHLVASLKGSYHLPIHENISSASLWVGPEGGWSEEEDVFFSSQQDVVLWKFNEAILRLETASIVGGGVMSYLFS